MPEYKYTAYFENEVLRKRPYREIDSHKVSEGVVLDYGADGNLVGIDIDQASTRLEIKELGLNKLPAEVKQVA